MENLNNSQELKDDKSKINDNNDQSVQEKCFKIERDKLPDILFKQEDLDFEERLHLCVFMSHFLMTYKEDSPDYTIEFPCEISHLNRMIVHHIADKLDLGSFTRGAKSKNKKIVIGPMELNNEKFIRAKKNRYAIVGKDIKAHKESTSECPEVMVQREAYEWTEKQIINKNNGLDFEKSWQIIMEENTENNESTQDKRCEISELNNDTTLLKDWSLSTKDFKLFISGENKESVNRSAFDEIEPIFVNEPLNIKNNDKIEVCEDKNSLSDHSLDQYDYLSISDEYEENSDKNILEERTNNLDQVDPNNMRLEEFEGRPDKVINIKLSNVSSNSISICWEIPECNNAPITEYIIKLNELNLETLKPSYKCIQRSETNSVTIDYLTENTWYIVDIRAQNKYGYCPIQSSCFYVKTINYQKGSLFSWGTNNESVLGISEDDVLSSKLYRKSDDIAIGPIKCNSFKNITCKISSSLGTSLMMIDKNSQNNLITCGLAFEYEDGQNPLMYNDEDIERHITSDPFVCFIPEKVIKIQCGLFFNILLTATGKVYSRGRNSFGQLGLQNSKFNSNNSTQDIKGSTIPVIIEDLIFNDDFVIDIAAGYSHCIALTFKRRIFIWGQKCNFPPNEVYEAKANQLINHQAFPKEIRGVLIHYNPQKVIAGGLFSGIITIDGKLLTFGFGENGQLGHLDHNQKPFGYLYEPKRVDFLDDYFVEDASFGNSHAFAIVRKKIKEDAISEEYKLEEQRLLFSWGENKYGQCGNGDYGNSLTPRRVKGLDDHNILQVSAGKSHTLILAEKDGSTSLYFCGDASNGSSGLTKTLKGNFSTPTIITLIDRYRKIENSEKMTDFIDICAGFDTSFIILK